MMKKYIQPYSPLLTFNITITIDLKNEVNEKIKYFFYVCLHILVHIPDIWVCQTCRLVWIAVAGSRMDFSKEDAGAVVVFCNQFLFCASKYKEES